LQHCVRMFDSVVPILHSLLAGHPPKKFSW
jgi:hypothetical protein